MLAVTDMCADMYGNEFPKQEMNKNIRGCFVAGGDGSSLRRLRHRGNQNEQEIFQRWSKNFRIRPN